MPAEMVFKCDHVGCEQVRTPTNKWVVFKRWSPQQVIMMSWHIAETDGHLDRGAQGVKMFCGQSHAAYYASQCLPEIAEG